MATAHLLGHLLPLKSVELGRLVLNANRPNQDFIDPADDPEIEKKFTKNLQDDFKETRRFSRSSNIKAYFSDIITFTYETQTDSIATLSAQQATTYDLENSGAWFKEVCAQPKIRKFLEQATQDSRNVYLVVGFRTVSDGRLVKDLTTTKNKGAGLQSLLNILPVGVASSSPGTNIIDPSVRSKRNVGNGQELAFGAPGEQVFAILYRKVKFKWFSRKTTDNMILETNNRWKSVWDWRGPAKDYIIEATLTDLDEDDLDVSDDDEESDGDETDGDETDDPQDKLSDSGLIEDNVQAVPNRVDSAGKVLSQGTTGGALGRRVRIEFYYGLILFAIICGGLSFYSYI